MQTQNFASGLGQLCLVLNLCFHLCETLFLEMMVFNQLPQVTNS